MAQSKPQSKGTPKNESIESTNSDNKSSASTTSDKSDKSTNLRNICTTYNDASENKSKSQLNGGLNLLFLFIHSV